MNTAHSMFNLIPPSEKWESRIKIRVYASLRKISIPCFIFSSLVA
jgi:hypothetical protein